MLSLVTVGMLEREQLVKLHILYILICNNHRYVMFGDVFFLVGEDELYFWEMSSRCFLIVEFSKNVKRLP